MQAHCFHCFNTCKRTVRPHHLLAFVPDKVAGTFPELVQIRRHGDLLYLQ